MTPTLSVRQASPADIAAVDALLARSYPRLLAADYTPSLMVLAIPRIARARPEASGGSGHVRHVATDPDLTRRGIGRALMGRVMQDARGAGVEWLDCLSTRTAVPFYAALGFRPLHPVDVPLAPGIVFPAIRMMADLRRTAL